MGFKKIANTKELTRSIFSKIKHRSWIARKKISFPTQNVISFLFNNAFKKGVDVRKRDFGREDRHLVARRYPLPIARFSIQARSNSQAGRPFLHGVLLHPPFFVLTLVHQSRSQAAALTAEISMTFLTRLPFSFSTA